MYHSYQHVERFGTNETEGIEIGRCFIFPKLDGTNGTLWWDNGLQAGSRRRHLDPTADNHGFLGACILDPRYERLFTQKPHWRLFGEWLVPHTIRTYREDAWRKFYVFDVVREEGDGIHYVHPDCYQPVLDDFGIDYIPYTHVITNPSVEQLRGLLDKNTFLMQEGEVGEGIVIKNYEYKNKWGRQTWAKIVRNEFKERAIKTMGATVMQGEQVVEQAIVDLYVTKALVRKELAKIENENTGKPVQSRLLSTVYHAILTEETWNYVKKFKNPVINFKVLQKLTYARTKEYAPEYF
jgi:hypothetical protein